MKRVAAGVLLAVMMIGLCACGDNNGAPSSETGASESPAIVINGEDEDISQIKIGFSLAGEGAFYDQLIADVKTQSTTHGYEPQIITADTAAQQETDMLAMLSDGCAVIILEPVEADALESALSECETQGVPVISIIDQVNGTVNMLISPYYKTIGEKAGGYAVDLLSEGGTCMMLCTQIDSFVMQLMSDGFSEAVGGGNDITLAAAPFCGSDEEKAYEQAADALKGETPVDFIFAQSAVLGRGALRAIDEAGTETTLVVFGGDMDIIEAVGAGDVYAALFIGPGQLAEQAVYHANKFIINTAYEAPQFDELNIGVVTADNAAEYISDTLLHAQVKSE